MSKHVLNATTSQLLVWYDKPARGACGRPSIMHGRLQCYTACDRPLIMRALSPTAVQPSRSGVSPIYLLSRVPCNDMGGFLGLQNQCWAGAPGWRPSAQRTGCRGCPPPRADAQVGVQGVRGRELLAAVGLRQEVVQQHALQLVAQVEGIQDGEVCVARSTLLSPVTLPIQRIATACGLCTCLQEGCLTTTCPSKMLL